MSRANQSSSRPPEPPAASNPNDADPESLLEMNHQEMVKTILHNKMHSWMNKELSHLIDDYFENILATLDSCTALQAACLKRASIINAALQEEHPTILEDFKTAGEPFTVPEFFKVFDPVYTKQISVLERSQDEKRKVNKEIRKFKAKRRAANIIFVVAFVSGMAAAAGLSLVSTGRWLRSILEKHEKELKTKMEIISAMQVGSYVVVQDLERIRVLVDRFGIEIEAVFGINADFANYKEKVDSLIKIVDELSENGNKCGEETRNARTSVLKRIIDHHHPSTSVFEIPQSVAADLLAHTQFSVYSAQTNSDHTTHLY